MAWKMPQRQTSSGSNIARASRARMKEMEMQGLQQRKMLKAQEKPWYEKYLIEPVIQIGTSALGGALGGALGEALSPAAAAATALSKQKTGDLAEKAMGDKFTTYMQGWLRQNPTLKASDWSFAKHGHLLDPDLKAWAAKREPTGRR